MFEVLSSLPNGVNLTTIPKEDVDAFNERWLEAVEENMEKNRIARLNSIRESMIHFIR